MGLVRSVTVHGDQVTVVMDCPADQQRRLKPTIERAIAEVAASRGLPAPSCTLAAAADASARKVLPGVTHVIAVGAGKGGVGKSMISTLLATALARQGARCGLLDGDIYGPSMGTMLGLDDLDTEARGNTLVPFDVHGIKAMTIAKLVDRDKPMIWRGPMAHKAFSQLLLQTDWGDLDYLIVDLPPGTGDVPLSLAQALPLCGAVIVCTPQRVAQDDARRAVHMFGELGVPILGLVENMSWFVGDDGREYDLFGRGGAEAMANNMSVPFLGALPLHISMRTNADEGTPLSNFNINPDISAAINHIAEQLTDQVAAQSAKHSTGPTITVSGQ
jgi:ATP-binding protein involved in chromosome partitioning